ncbi:hypothetical protein [Streptomyces lanatus]|uniref:Uncharacterized protein n=1 Tax=Streptomyces lanatus TaxID=66900 RepID=A0ABV1Y3U1_9ACTN|nr:hypothetical protein [Streptomyces lanatus]GHH27214.1 hypothetical protein GCM10018780_81760 [Streptomyces lanatus]
MSYLMTAAAAAAGAAIPHAVSLAGQWIAARGGHAQAAAARDAAERAARSTFEDKAREAQRAAHVALIESAHAVAEHMRPVLWRAVEEYATAENQLSVRLTFASEPRTAFRTSLARVELEGPPDLIPLAHEVAAAVEQAEERCRSELPFLAARHRLSPVFEEPSDRILFPPGVGLVAVNALLNLSRTETPSMPSLGRLVILRGVTSAMNPQARDTPPSNQDQAHSIRAADPEEVSALTAAYRETAEALRRAIDEGAVTEDQARDLLSEAVQGRRHIDAPIAPWDQIHAARVRFTDAARTYLHTMPGPAVSL